MSIELSQSLEDYLEAILMLADKDGSARVKDIADKIGVAMPSVTGALKKLSALGLVVYGPYSSVELTKEGRKEASRVADRHMLFARFLGEVLGVARKTADEDACAIEHQVSAETVKALKKYFDAMDKNLPAAKKSPSGKQQKLLDSAKPGDRLKVLNVGGKGAIQKRLMDMGIVRGAEVLVIRFAPLGDPLEIRIKGTRLSLRKKEAAAIEVEPIVAGA